jgi:hypothetical protein
MTLTTQIMLTWTIVGLILFIVTLFYARIEKQIPTINEAYFLLVIYGPALWVIIFMLQIFHFIFPPPPYDDQ